MPYVLSFIGVPGMILIGKGKWFGWGLAFTNECLWLVFAITTRQYGFIIGALCYGSVNAYNYWNWKNNDNYISHSG